MSITLEVVIDVPDYEVDMKSGLDTMQGISDAVRTVAEAVYEEKVHERLTSTSTVRTTLMKTFKGSFGQSFKIELYNEDAKKRYKYLGKNAFAELFTYFVSESLFKESPQLSERSISVLDALGEKSEEVVSRLRNSHLDKIHQVTSKFGHGIQVRHRKSGANKIVLAQFNQETASVLSVKESDKVQVLEIIVSRLNTFTGNGRLVVKGESSTVAFGFSGDYKYVEQSTKRLLSDNLDRNNGAIEKNYEYLRLKATPVQRPDGLTVKYIIKGFL